MKLIKGPGIFLAQFAGDAAPFNSFDSICGWAASLGYEGVQIPTWDGRLFDLKRASESQDYADEVRGIAARHGLAGAAMSGISIRNVGQDASGVTLAITVPGDTLPPSAPSGLAAVADGTTAQLRWNAATDDFSVDDYVVKRDGAQVGTPVATSFTDTGLVPGTTVSYTVAAVDAGGNIGPAAAVSLAIPDTTAPGAPAKVTAKVTKKGQVQLAWAAATDNGRVVSYRIRRAGRQIATATGRAFVDKSPKPGSGSSVTYSVVAVDAAGNAGPAGKAIPVRAALLRKLAVSRLRIAGVALGPQALVTVKGTVSDVRAICRVRVGRGAWRRCRPNAAGHFSATVGIDASKLVSISLRDQLGRVKQATLRIP